MEESDKGNRSQHQATKKMANTLGPPAAFGVLLDSSRLTRKTATYALENTIKFRHMRNAARSEHLEQMRKDSQYLNDLTNPVRMEEERLKKKADKDHEELVGSFMRGDNVLRNVPREQLQDVDRESKLYQEAAAVISESDVMASDFRTGHIGEIYIPELSKEEVEYFEKQEDYIRKMNGRTDIFRAAAHYRKEVAQLYVNINEQEEEVASIIKDVSLHKAEREFEWQVEMQNRVRFLRAKTLVELEDLEAARNKLKAVTNEINLKFPDLSSKIRLDTDIPEDDLGVVYGWCIGLLDSDNDYDENAKIINLMFGQFTREYSPPESGYVFVGSNINRNQLDSVLAAERQVKQQNEEAEAEAAALRAATAATARQRKKKKRAKKIHPLSTSITMEGTDSLSVAEKNETGNGEREGVEGGEGEGESEEDWDESLMGDFIQSEHKEPSLSSSNAPSLEASLMKSLGFKLTDAQIAMCKYDHITITPFTKINNSTKASLNFNAKTVTAYRVAGCSIEEINGEYLEAGKSSKVTKYRNVRGWNIFRAALIEVPELNILADNCYSALKGPSINVVLERKAKLAFSELVNTKGEQIVEGSVQFKRRFAEISRAGTRIINEDQTDQLLFNNNLRASVKNESDQALMAMLAAVMSMKQAQNEGQDEHKSLDNGMDTTFHVGDTVGETKGEEGAIASPASPNAKVLQDSNNKILQPPPGSPSTPTRVTRQGFNTGDVTNETKGSPYFLGSGLDTSSEVIEGKDANPPLTESLTGSQVIDMPASSQSKSLRYEFKEKEKESYKSKKIQTFDKKRMQDSLLSSSVASVASSVQSWGEDGYVTGTNLDIKVTLSHSINYQTGSQGFPVAKSKKYIVKEAELAREVTRCIEERESALMTLRIEAEMAQRKYLESEELLAKLDLDELVGKVFDQVRALRDATVKVAEALGAWSRLCALEKNRKTKSYSLEDRKDPRADRTYCVVIAYKGNMLYPPSEPVQSNAKTFRRGMEEVKSSTDLKIVGEFKTRDEAAMAFDKAYAAIPLEQHLEPGGGGGKMLVGLRPCGKHYLARSIHVPVDLLCEVCTSKKFSKPNAVVPQVSAEPLPQFIWQGKNYMEKMWTDVGSFLKDNLLLKKVAPQLDVTNNPLLLPRETYKLALESLFLKPDDPLMHLKGELEQIEDAQKAGTRVMNTLTGHELMGVAYLKDYNRKSVDLDRHTDTLLQTADQTFTYADGWTAGVRGRAKDDSFTHTMGRSGDNNNNSMKGTAGQNVDDAHLAVRTVIPQSTLSSSPKTNHRPSSSPQFTPWSTLSPIKSLDTATLGLSFDPLRLRDKHRRSGKNCLSWLNVNMEDTVEVERLRRALSILGHSSTLTKTKLHPESVPSMVNESQVKRQILRSKTSENLKAKSLGGQQHSSSAKVSQDDGMISDDVIGGFVDATTDYSKVPGFGKGKTVYTEAVYNYRGAKLVSGQMRVPLATRVDDVWCRTDEGEFYGLSKGRSARSFDFKIKILEEGKARNKERKIVQNELRHLITLHIASVDTSRILYLMERARILKGSTLELDVKMAETYLRNRNEDIKKVKIIQRYHRGKIARERFRLLRLAATAAARKKRAQIVLATNTARAMIPPIIESCLAARIKEDRKPSMFVGANKSGMYSVISVYRKTRFAQRSLDLCISCQTKSIVRKFDPIKETYYVERAPCTCELVQTPETWWIRAQDPLTGVFLEKTYDIHYVRETIQGILNSRALMDPSTRLGRLVGKTFGSLAALFDQKEASFDLSAPEKGYSLARLKAAAESSLLPLLPKSLAAELVSLLSKRIPLAVDKLKEFEYVTTKGPTTVTHALDLERARIPEWDFQPLQDIQTTIRTKHRTQHRQDILVRDANQFQHEYEMAVQKEILHRTTTLEWDAMQFEDIRARVVRTIEGLEQADRKLSSVMRFSKSGLEKFEQEEKNLSEDWHQGYEEFEDGNGWNGLNVRRKIEKVLRVEVEEFRAKYSKLGPNIELNLQNQRDVIESRLRSKVSLSESEAYRPTHHLVGNIESSVKMLASETVNAFISTLALPRKGKKSSRRIQKMPYNLVFIRDPLERCRKENRKAWLSLDRRVMALRPIASLSKFVLRCIVEIFTDPVTGYYIIHIGQDELPVEESTQHIDLHLSKKDFSDLTSHGLENDIVLRPQDVDHILSKSPAWPAEHLVIPVVKFENTSLTVKQIAAEAAAAEAAALAAAEAAAAAAAAAAAPVMDSSDDDSNSKPGTPKGRKSAVKRRSGNDLRRAAAAGGSKRSNVQRTGSSPTNASVKRGGGNHSPNSTPSLTPSTTPPPTPSRAVRKVMTSEISPPSSPVSTPTHGKRAGKDEKTGPVTIKTSASRLHAGDDSDSDVRSVGSASASVRSAKSGTASIGAASSSPPSIVAPSLKPPTPLGQQGVRGDGVGSTSDEAAGTKNVRENSPPHASTKGSRTKNTKEISPPSSPVKGDSSPPPSGRQNSPPPTGRQSNSRSSSRPASGKDLVPSLTRGESAQSQRNLKRVQSGLVKRSDVNDKSSNDLPSKETSSREKTTSLSIVTSEHELEAMEIPVVAEAGSITSDKHGDVQNETHQPKRKSKSQVVEYIPPSLRPRSLDGIRVIAHKGKKYDGLAKTYALRKKNEFDAQMDKAARLFQYLRLQPHTGRPCMGLLHFMRRIEYAVKRVCAGYWFKDLSKENPLSWANEIDNSIRVRSLCSRSGALIAARWCLHHVQVNVTSQGKILSVVVPLEDVLTSLANKPLLLAAFMCELMTNTVSADTISSIVDHLDIELPGSDAMGGRWRYSLRTELPRLLYQKDETAKYRGPIYCTHKFFVGTYFRVSFYINDKDDLRLKFSVPNDGLFWAHCYKGKDLYADISCEEQRVYASKVCWKKGLVPDQFYGNMDFLHPNNWEIFFNLLLDTIILSEGVSNGIPFVNPPTLGEGSSFSQRTLQKSISTIAQKFNAWSLRTQKMQPLPSQIINTMTQTVDGFYTDSPQWTLELYRDISTRKMVEVYAEVWQTKEVERFMGIKGFREHQRKQKEALISLYGAPAQLLMSYPPEHTDIFDEDTVGAHHDSYWRVRVLTEEARDAFVLEILPAGIDSLTVQAFLAEKERDLMDIEDVHSQRVRKFNQNLEWQNKLSDKLRQLDHELNKEVLPSLLAIQSTLEISKKIAREAQAKVLARADAMNILFRRATYHRLKEKMHFVVTNIPLGDSEIESEPSACDLVIGSAAMNAPNEQEENTTGISSPGEVEGGGSSNIDISSLMISKQSKSFSSEWTGHLDVINKNTHTRAQRNNLPAPLLAYVSWMEGINYNLGPPSSPHTSPIPYASLEFPVTATITKIDVSRAKKLKDVYMRGSAMYNTSDYPRHSPYNGMDLTGAQLVPGFRDGRRFSRSNFIRLRSLERADEASTQATPLMIKTKENLTIKGPNIDAIPSVMRIDGQLVIVSPPRFGDADMVEYDVYNPLANAAWTVCGFPYQPNVNLWQKESLPSTTPLSNLTDQTERNNASNVDGDKQNLPDCQIQCKEATHVSAERHIAERVVWRALLSGVTSAVCQSLCETLDQTEDQLNKKVSSLMKKIDQVNDMLEEAQAEEHELEEEEKEEEVAAHDGEFDMDEEEWYDSDEDSDAGSYSSGSEASIDVDPNEDLDVDLDLSMDAESSIFTAESTVNKDLTSLLSASMLPDSDSDDEDDYEDSTSVVTMKSGTRSPAGSYRGRAKKKIKGTLLAKASALNDKVVKFFPDVCGNVVTIIYIPADEAMSYSCLQTYAVHIPLLQRQLLQRIPTVRLHTLSSIIFTKSAPDVTDGWPGDDRPNPRLSRWVREYKQYNGWRKDVEAAKKVAHTSEIEIAHHPLAQWEGETPYGQDIYSDGLFNGDAMLVLRNNDDLELIRGWLKARYEEYAPIREMRLQKEGRERQFRISQHAKFRHWIFELGEKFLEGMETIFDYRTTAVRENPFFLTSHCRVLLSQYLTLRNICDDSPLSIEEKLCDPLTLDEAFLLDTDFAHTDECLVRFDHFVPPTLELEHKYPTPHGKLGFDKEGFHDSRWCPQPPPLLSYYPVGHLEHGVDGYPKGQAGNIEVNDNEDVVSVAGSDSVSRSTKHSPLPIALHPDVVSLLEWNPKQHYVETTKLGKSSMKRHDLAPRAGQVVYAMYQLHVCRCARPLNLCTFPGCNWIREQSIAEMKSLSDEMATRTATSAVENPRGRKRSQVATMMSAVTATTTSKEQTITTDDVLTTTNTNQRKEGEQEDDNEDLDPNSKPPSHTPEGIVVTDEVLIETFFGPKDVVNESVTKVVHKVFADHPNSAFTLMSTGQHPIEKYIKMYILYGIAISRRIVLYKDFVAAGKGSRLPEEEEEEERQADAADLKRLKDIEDLKVEWRVMLRDAEHFRRLNKRLVKPEMLSIMNSEDILEVKGGVDGGADYGSKKMNGGRGGFICDGVRSEDEADLSQYVTSAHLKDLALVDAPALPRSKTKDQQLNTLSKPRTLMKTKSSFSLSSSSSSTQHTVEPLYVSFPRQLAFEMLGGHLGGHGICLDGQGHSVHTWAIDPYPAFRADAHGSSHHHHSHHHHSHHHHNDSHEGDKGAHSSHIAHRHPHGRSHRAAHHAHPMSNVMFHWLTKKLTISRPYRIPGPTSGDRGQFIERRYAVKFDRLHCECATSLYDGSIITMQLLHGVLMGAATSVDNHSGVPPAAIRHLPTHLVPNLAAGLTIVVYDIRSDVSVCVNVEGKHLPRYSEAFGTTEGDIPQLCRQMITMADKFVRLSRVGEVCTGMTLDIGSVQSILVAAKVRSPDEPPSKSISNPPPTSPAVNVSMSTAVTSARTRSLMMGRRQAVVDKRADRMSAIRAILSQANKV